jgi:hypothetical protein
MEKYVVEKSTRPLDKILQQSSYQRVAASKWFTSKKEWILFNSIAFSIIVKKNAATGKTLSTRGLILQWGKN